MGCPAQYLLNDCKVRNPGTSLLQQLFRFVFLSSWNEIKAIFQQPVKPDGEQVFSEITNLLQVLFCVFGGCIFFYFQEFYLPAAKAFFFLVLSLLYVWAHLIVTH